MFFAQYLTIWYGNLPEEVMFIHKRISVPPFKQLSQTFLTFITDSNRWVRLVAFKQLGSFIHALGPSAPDQFLRYFVDMINNNSSSNCGNDSSDAECLAEYCGYCFPAVVAAVGVLLHFLLS